MNLNIFQDAIVLRRRHEDKEADLATTKGTRGMIEVRENEPPGSPRRASSDQDQPGLEGLQVEIEALRTGLLAVSRRLNETERALGGLDRLKGELASLRGALLGRAEDRSGLALALERLRAELTALRADTTSLSERVESDGKALLDRLEFEARRSSERLEPITLLTERLARMELTVRRFEVFYESLPIRWFRTLYVSLRGIVRR